MILAKLHKALINIFICTIVHYCGVIFSKFTISSNLVRMFHHFRPNNIWSTIFIVLTSHFYVKNKAYNFFNVMLIQRCNISITISMFYFNLLEENSCNSNFSVYQILRKDLQNYIMTILKAKISNLVTILMRISVIHQHYEILLILSVFST